MHHVHLVQRQHVDVLLHLLHGEEVPRDVEHRTAIREPWPIGDLAGGTVHVARRPKLISDSIPAGRSCRSVCVPWNSPAGVAARIRTESALTVSS